MRDVLNYFAQSVHVSVYQRFLGGKRVRLAVRASVFLACFCLISCLIFFVRQCEPVSRKHDRGA